MYSFNQCLFEILFGCCSDAESDLFRDGAHCSHDHQVSPQQGEGATRRPLLPPPTGDVSLIIVDYRAPPVCPPAEAPSATLPRSLPLIGKTLPHQNLITPAPFIALLSHRKRRQEGCHCRTVHTLFKKGRLVCHRNQWRLLMQSRHDHAPNYISV